VSVRRRRAELPVVRALKQSITCSANDIVVHRPDGRRIPLITWAAPVKADNSFASWTVVVDAGDGTVLRIQPDFIVN
jgi:hypothetical protein